VIRTLIAESEMDGDGVDDIIFRLLGPVEAGVGGQRVPVDGARQRAVLAVLAVLTAGRAVTTDRDREAV
jgi:hypothetical protein